MDVNPGTIVVWADVACPWATLAVHRLRKARAELDLEGKVVLDLRAFPLELFNEHPTPKPVLDAEIPVVGALGADFGWQVWQYQEYLWPDSSLLALEAVQAAKEQSLAASEELDWQLRRAFFAESRSISMRHVILDVAARCPLVDAGKLQAALDEGRSRADVIDQYRAAQTSDVQGSPHLFLPDGSDVANPGVTVRWVGKPGKGFPVVTDDDPSVFGELVRRAAGA